METNTSTCGIVLEKGWGKSLSRSGHLEEENGNLGKTDCKESRWIVSYSEHDIRGVKRSDSVNRGLVAKLLLWYALVDELSRLLI
jgi:hypothetical protein